MRVVALADQHGHLPALPPCDLILLAGDIVALDVQRSHLKSARWLDGPFRAWLQRQAAPVVATWGNHDFIGEQAPQLVPADLPWTLLVDAEATVAGLRIYGSPWQPWFHDWAFNVRSEDRRRAIWAGIPAGLDVLLLHGPPYGVGDETQDRRLVGCRPLRDRIEVVRPKVTVFGHIHHARGMTALGDLRLFNCAVLDEQYRPTWPLTTFEV